MPGTSPALDSRQMQTWRSASVTLIAVAFFSYPSIIHGQSLTITTLAGPPAERGSADGTGGAAGFFNPGGVATDGDGNVYVADTGNQIIRKISPAGEVTTFAGLAGQSGSANGKRSASRFGSPSGVAVDRSGNVYVTSANLIRRITAAGEVTTLAGTLQGGTADGTES